VSSVAVCHTSTSFVETIAGNKAHSVLAFFKSRNIDLLQSGVVNKSRWLK
jgi:hypothetical protein